jgi:hypothetical protein
MHNPFLLRKCSLTFNFLMPLSLLPHLYLITNPTTVLIWLTFILVVLSLPACLHFGATLDF